MFICLDCGEIFEEPGTFSQRHPYGEGYATETLACCPYCGSSFAEAEQCTVCGEWFEKYDITDGLCDECVKELEEENE
jgi:hypothetical protein